MTGQGYLFDFTKNTVGPWRQGQPDTSRQAALANYPRSGSQRARLLAVLARAGERGLNAYEASVAAGVPRMHTAHTRMAELAKSGLAVMTEVTRPTDTNTESHVWQITPAGLEAARSTAA